MLIGKSPIRQKLHKSINRTFANITKELKLFTGCIRGDCDPSSLNKPANCKCDKYQTKGQLIDQKTKSYITFLADILSGKEENPTKYEAFRY